MEMKKVRTSCFSLLLEIKFWTLARWAVSQFAHKNSLGGKQEETSTNSSSNTITVASDGEEKLPMYIVSELLLDEASSIKKSEMETAELYYSKQISISSANGTASVQNYELKKKIAEYSIDFCNSTN